MTQDEIIEMARLVSRQPDRIYAPDECEFLYYFAKLVTQHEREACAKIADIAEPYKSADLIRARGQA